MKKTQKTSNSYSNLDKIALAQGYRSGLEHEISKSLTSKGVSFVYEGRVIKYTKPAKEHKYHPDWELPNGIVVESKGRFLTADRQKHILVKAQHPNIDIRFVFGNSKTRISKLSATTYGMWCNKHGFIYADKGIPDAWLTEEKKS